MNYVSNLLRGPFLVRRWPALLVTLQAEHASSPDGGESVLEAVTEGPARWTAPYRVSDNYCPPSLHESAITPAPPQ